MAVLCPGRSRIQLPVTAPLVERWYAWDVFRSLPFAAILTVLAVAISICTINRAPGIWQAIAHPTVTTTHGFLRNAETSARFSSELPPTDLLKHVASAMRGSGYRTLSAERHDEIHLYGDRWRFSRLATFPFHLALILILVGGIVGAAWGFRENELIIPEGSTRELGHGTGLTVRLDDFSEVYREDGTALEYRSDITLQRQDGDVASGSMTVNNPFTFGDVVFYQSGFGQAVALRVVDAAGMVLFDDALPLGPFQSKLNPDAPAARMDLAPAGVALSVVAPGPEPRQCAGARHAEPAAGRVVLHDPTPRTGQPDRHARRRNNQSGGVDLAWRSQPDFHPRKALLRPAGGEEPGRPHFSRGGGAAGRGSVRHVLLSPSPRARHCHGYAGGERCSPRSQSRGVTGAPSGRSQS